MAETGNVSVVEFLMDRSADYFIADRNNMTALHYAVIGNHLSVVECLLKYKPIKQVLLRANYGWSTLQLENFNITQNNSNWSAIHFALMRGYTSVADCLLNHQPKKQLMLKDCHGYTALQLSAMCGQETSIEVILKHLPIAQHLVMYQEAL